MLNPEEVQEMAATIKADDDGLTPEGVVAKIARTTGWDPADIQQALDASPDSDGGSRKKKGR